MRAPTQARWALDSEWTILTRVFGSTMPFKQRIFITDGLGGDDAPFTIPTSAISALPAVFAGALSGGLLGGPAGAAVGTAISAVGSFLASAVNLGYLVNIGSGPYSDMSSGTYTNAKGRSGLQRNHLLVHEMTHVWQGKNSIFALSYVINSAYNQCKGMLGSGGVAGRNAAYNYLPLKTWSEYNAEQQAALVEAWFAGGELESGDLWPYIRDKVRKGKA